MSEQKLKPCPFCGATFGVHLSRERDTPDMNWQYKVVCDYNLSGCGGSGGFSDDPTRAIEAWNRRTNDEHTN